MKILVENGFSASISEVTGVSLEDKPGGLHKVLAVLAEAGIAVHYISFHHRILQKEKPSS